ncbi:PAS domain-containing sensor histidine kinase [Minwuia sp.]|uniref:PAS domain-containing sensor histidine kinase n=1 Tax=Minwuia sp. TaxID=2493630 RepID=UPI003A940F48
MADVFRKERRLGGALRLATALGAVVAGSVCVALVLPAVAETGLGHASPVGIAILAGLSGFAIAHAMHVRRRRRLTGEIAETVGTMFDGIALYHPSGLPLDEPGGILASLPGAERRERLADELLASATPLLPAGSDHAGDQTLEDFRSGRGTTIELALPNGPIVKIRQQPTPSGAVLMLARDISDRVRRDDESRKRERKFTQLAEIASDWTWETDTEHVFTEVSDSFARLTGAPVTALVGRRVIEVADVRAAPVDIRELMRHFQDQDGFSDIVIPLRISGRHGQVWVRFAGRPRISDSGGFLGFRGAAADVTREYLAETRAESANRALHDAIASVSEGLALFDPQGEFLMCNSRLANEFAPAAHMLRPGVKLTSLVNELLMTGLLRIPEVSPKGATATVAAEIENVKMRREFRASNNRWFKISLNRSADDGAVMVVSDITDHKSHEAELDAKIEQLETARAELMDQKEALSELADNLANARNEAEAANRAKSEFLAAMSHELRTPLNAVIGFSEVMATEGLGPLGTERYKEYSNDILSSGQHLLTLINNILDLSKAEAGKLELHPQAMSLRSVIEASARMACPRDRETALTLAIDPDADELIADMQKIKQILINLISNAIKFTPEGGRIEVRARRIPGHTEIRVADSGIGMKPEDIPGALTAFKQIDSSLGRKFEGTGLGLPLALRFAQIHGGDLTVESRPGEGTTVIVTIPDRVPKAAVA